MARCSHDHVHEPHEWLCPWVTPTRRWCPGRTEPKVVSYYRGASGQPRAFDVLRECRSPLPDPDPRGAAAG
jgi:hypothetical protein